MATPKSQRIGIWVIAVVMLVGTIGSFAVMVLASDNDRKEQAEQQKIYEEYQKEMEKQQAEAKKLATTHYPIFEAYESTPKQFDPKTVGSKVVKKDLKVGSGAEIKDGDGYVAYYIGWNPDGKTFDSSFEGGSLKAPLETTGTSGELIPGWEQGVIGMKVGGVRQLTIPAKLAYDDQSPSEDIPANSPLKFIVYIIEKK